MLGFRACGWPNQSTIAYAYDEFVYKLFKYMLIFGIECLQIGSTECFLAPQTHIYMCRALPN